MKSMISAPKSLLVTLFVLLGLVVLSGQTNAIGPRYKIIDLDDGGDYSAAYGINNVGQVVGTVEVEDWEDHAFLWENGVMLDLGAFEDGEYSTAYSINNVGQVVGWADIVGDEDWHAFLWEDGEGMQDLGTLGGDWSDAYAINNVGQVVGGAETEDWDYRAFLWDDGVMQDLGALGGEESCAYSINDVGQVVGGAETEDWDGHAFLWEDGVMTDLGALGGDWSAAYAINSSGQVVGGSETDDWYEHAFLWENGVMTDLGALGGDWSNAYAINTAGQVVGTAETEDWYDHAFLWDDDQMLDLNELVPADSGWELRRARGINDLGQIVGSGRYNGRTHAFLLMPVEYVHPHTATIQRGSVVSGDVDSVEESDGVYHIVKAARRSGRQITEIYYTGTTEILEPSYFDFRFEGVGGSDSRPDIKVYVYNYTNSSWDKVHPTTFRGTDNTWSCSFFTDGDDYVYLRNGEVKCKVTLSSTSSRGNCIGSDLVEWAIGPAADDPE